MPFKFCMTLGKSFHLSVVPFIIYKMGMNVSPASKAVGRAGNNAGEVLAQYLAHSESSMASAIWIALKTFQSLMAGGTANQIIAIQWISATNTKLNKALGGERGRSNQPCLEKSGKTAQRRCHLKYK